MYSRARGKISHHRLLVAQKNSPEASKFINLLNLQPRGSFMSGIKSHQNFSLEIEPAKKQYTQDMNLDHDSLRVGIGSLLTP